MMRTSEQPFPGLDLCNLCDDLEMLKLEFERADFTDEAAMDQLDELARRNAFKLCHFIVRKVEDPIIFALVGWLIGSNKTAQEFVIGLVNNPPSMDSLMF